MSKRGMSLLACWMIGIAGCGVEDATQLGTLEVPLTAPGADGALYRLPTGTALHVHAGDFFDAIVLDGGQGSIAADLPTGFYAGSYLTDADRRTPASWQLIRQDPDGTVATVEASLDPIPSFMVSSGASTQLALQFHVARAGTIQFAFGDLGIALVAVEEPAASYAFELAGAVTAYDLRMTSTAPAGFVARLAPLDAAEIHYVARGSMAGWHLAGENTACAAATFAVTVDGPSAASDAVHESLGEDPVELCIVQSDSLATWYLQSWRAGAPTTALFSDLDVASVFALKSFSGSFRDVVLEHGALHLDRLTSPRTTTAHLYLQLGDSVDAPRVNTWATLAAEGEGSMTVTPQR